MMWRGLPLKFLQICLQKQELPPAIQYEGTVKWSKNSLKGILKP